MSLPKFNILIFLKVGYNLNFEAKWFFIKKSIDIQKWKPTFVHSFACSPWNTSSTRNIVLKIFGWLSFVVLKIGVTYEEHCSKLTVWISIYPVLTDWPWNVPSQRNKKANRAITMWYKTFKNHERYGFNHLVSCRQRTMGKSKWNIEFCIC